MYVESIPYPPQEYLHILVHVSSVTIARKWHQRRCLLTHGCRVKVWYMYAAELCVCVCVHVCVCLCVHVCLFVCVSRSQISTLGVFPDFPSVYILRHGFSLNPFFIYLVRDPSVSMHLALGSQMQTTMSVCCCCCFLIWVLGIWIQAPMLVWVDTSPTESIP